MRGGVVHPCPIQGKPHIYYLTLWKSKVVPWKWATLYWTRRPFPQRFAWVNSNLSRGFVVRLFGWRIELNLRLYWGRKPYYGRRRA